MGTILEELRSFNLQNSLKGFEEEKKDSGEIKKDSPDTGKTLRGVYRCRVCGYIFDEALEGKPFSELETCPICKQGPGAFQQIR